MYEIDVPIKNSEKDKLNRSKFVEILSNSILDYNDDECLVIGLMGEWGCGKTSIINMLCEKIDEFNDEQSPDNQWVHIKFNPWYFSNQNSILYHFLDFLMEEFNKLNHKNKIITSLSKFKDKLSNFSFNASYLGTGFGVAYDNPDTDSNIYKSFNSLKRDLMDLFQNLEYKIVISIDDIDRLSDEEMQQIFLLVKALADFPKVIYILSFDKNVALKALTNLQVYSPEKFLEKIIQIPILVPEITQSRLSRLVENKLKPIYEKNNKLMYNNFEEIFSLIMPFFSNIRDIKRYTNVLNFYLNQFKDEVNIGDYLLMITIQLFEDEFYHKLKDSKNLLTNYENITKMDNEMRIKTYERFLKEFSNPYKYNSNNIHGLLGYLFPVLKKYANDEQSYNNERFESELKICSSVHFDKYFTFSVEDDEVSQIDVENLLNLENQVEISQMITDIVEQGKSQSLLDKLRSNVYKIERENCKYFISSLFDIGDEIEFTPKVYSVLDSLCDNLGYKSFNVILDSLESAKSFYTICYFIHETGYKYGLYYADESRLKEYCYLEFDEFKMIKDIAYQKIKMWAQKGTLLDKPHGRYYLDFWQKWGTKVEVNEFIKININTDKKLIRFIDRFKIKYEEQYYESEIDSDYTFDWHRLYEYCDSEFLEANILMAMDNGNLSESERELCELFIARNNEGGA